MKVLFFLPNVQMGGAERVMITIMNGVDRSRIQPAFLTLDDAGPLRTLVAQDIPVRSLNRDLVFRSLPQLYKAIRAEKPSIVVSTMAPMNFSMLVLGLFLPRVKFVVREAALPSLILTTHPRFAFAIRIAYRLLYPLADRIIVPSCAIMNELSAKIGLRLAKADLLYNPVDTEMVRVRALTPVRPVPDEVVHFVAAGRLCWPKGFDRLVEALPKMNLPHPWRLTILGEGEDRAQLEALIAQYNLGDRVILHGYAENPWAYYAAADCFLLSSRSEGMPNVALESLACGTRVIASREAGGINDIAALTAPGVVTLASDMDEFIRAMEKVTPSNHREIQPSLLPNVFEKKVVVDKFTDILYAL